MKRVHLFSLGTMVGILFFGEIVFAQSSVVSAARKGGRQLESIQKGVSQLSVRKVPAVAPLPTVTAKSSVGALPSSSLSIASSLSKNIATPLSATLASKIEAEKLDKRLHPILPRGPFPMFRSTFQARQTGLYNTNFFSGFVFKIDYNGQEEIYGVVAAHAISKRVRDYSLRREFTVDVYSPEERGFVSVWAKIVQTSAPGLLDIALVKFNPKDEKLFIPLQISTQEVRPGDKLSSHGFSGMQVMNIPDRQMLQATPFSLRTTMPWPRLDRMGLCGSPVLNQYNGLVGIHTGSVYGRFGEQDDVGYATHAKFLRTLVEAYHNNGQASFPFEIDGQKIMDLDVNEDIYHVKLLDERNKTLYKRDYIGKFAYREFKESIEAVRPRYAEILTRQVRWAGKNEEFLMEGSNTWTDKSRKIYKYDFETKQLISVISPRPLF